MTRVERTTGRHMPEVHTDQSGIKFGNVCSAVAAFFSTIAETIVSFFSYCWRGVSHLVSPCKEEPHAMAALNHIHHAAFRKFGVSLQEKLATYTDMPKRSTEFLKKAMECHMSFLIQKDATLAQQLQERTGFATLEEADVAKVDIPPALRPNQANVFWQGIEESDPDAINKGMMAAVRAYVFSGCRQRIDLFRKIVRYQLSDRTAALQEIQHRFKELPEEQKLILLDHDNLDGVEVSPKTKDIFNDMVAQANDLIQSNPNYARAFQGVPARIFP